MNLSFKSFNDLYITKLNDFYIYFSCNNVNVNVNVIIIIL